MNELDQAKLEQWRLDGRADDLARAQDEARADAQRREDEARDRESYRTESLREYGEDYSKNDTDPSAAFPHPEPQTEAEFFADEERRVPESAVRPYAHDPDPDPGWLDRWEREGTLKDLTPDERAKLEQIDREDPMGRGMREQFLPREVLGIRANSDRWVEQQSQERAAKAASAEQAREEAPKKAPHPAPEPEQDDELEM